MGFDDGFSDLLVSSSRLTNCLFYIFIEDYEKNTDNRYRLGNGGKCL